MAPAPASHANHSCRPFGGPVEYDADIAKALKWLAISSGDEPGFFDRLAAAQQHYRNVTSEVETHVTDLAWSDLGPDLVAAYLAQAKSLLDDRRSYDFALASHVAPWLKQLGANLPFLAQVRGATARALRMLRNGSVLPDSAIFELVMASNYAADGSDVAFIDEGTGRTPDLRLSGGELDRPLVVELKRLQRSDYEIAEGRQHAEIFCRLEPFLRQQALSVYLDVTYEKPLSDVPLDYLLKWVRLVHESPFVLADGYPWHDDFGSGVIRHANITDVQRDTRETCLYVGTKMARLLSGRVVSENNYHLAVQASTHPRDPRYVEDIKFGSVVTWQCIAPKSITRKAKFVRSKLAEADRQVVGHGRGIIHIAMDAELHSDASDLRRQRNKDALASFDLASQTAFVFLHYFVPRVSENHSWLTDETVDVFSRLGSPPPPFRAFTDVILLDNDQPAWRQELWPKNLQAMDFAPNLSAD